METSIPFTRMIILEIYPENLAAYDIVNGLKMSWVRQRWDVHGGALVMLGIKLRETCEILDRPLKELCKPDSPYYIVAIRRDGDTIIPGGNDVLKMYDLVYFMVTKQYIPYVRKIVGKEHYVDVKNVMIMGGGDTAVRALKNMPEYMNVKLMEHDVERCDILNDQIDDQRVMVINGDGRDLQLLNEEGIHTTQAFVALHRHRNHHQQEGYRCQSYLSDDARRRGEQCALPDDGKR